MSFISYAQNYEDVMLWRALKDIENGFYIDVGAAWPDEHSVTKAFYERGWRGINIEPNPVHHASLVKQRTRDINLQLAIGECAGQSTMNLVGDTGLSTLDTAIADKHKDGGWGVVEQTVSVDTLASVCAQHLPTGQEVHFLKVDVEGFEKQALRSYNWKESRPWIVLVEATLPMTQQESYEGWEPILLGADYLFAYADGLNRFYVAKAHAKLALELKYPPNVFDGFLLIDQEKTEAKAQQAEVIAQQAEAKAQQAEAKAQQAEVKAQQAEDKAQQAEVKAQQAEDKAQEAEVKAQQAEDKAQQAEVKAQQAEAAWQYSLAALEAVHASKSWRFTSPLRWLFGQARRLRQEGFLSRVKAFFKKSLRKINHELLSRPALRHKVIGASRRLGIHATLKSLLRKSQGQSVSPNHLSRVSHEFEGLNLVRLSPRARQIYTDLKKVIEEKNTKGRC